METLFEDDLPGDRGQPTRDADSAKGTPNAEAKDTPNGGPARAHARARGGPGEKRDLPDRTAVATPPRPTPLAAQMRPASLAEFAGQEHLLGEGSALRGAIEQGHPHSMVLYGPPGSGKTTLARMLGSGENVIFEELSAVQAGRAEVRAVIERAAHRRGLANGQQTVLFLDEIHRFNK